MKTRFDADQAQSPMGEVGQPRDHAYFEALGSRIRNKLLVAYITPLIVLTVLFNYLYADRDLWPTRLVLDGIALLMLCLIVFFVPRFARGLVARLEAADTSKRKLTDQLFSAAKMASVGEMAAGVAHEINNPLAIIYEEASMILDIMNPEFGMQLDMADLQERLTVIKEATMRGRNITRNLLAFSRKNDPDPKTIDINDLITRTLKTRETACMVANVVIKTELDRHIPKVTLNPNQMVQVIVNLVNNAKDAMPEGGTLTVRTGAAQEGVRIQVQDTGSGMSPEVMQRIFFPFFTTKVVGKGTGLGLSISYGIIKSFGGRIEVQSEVDQGTTFIIELPAAKPDGG
jgi:two-component system NtrC family sensor kinase